MKRLFSIIICVSCVMAVFAVPALRVRRSLQLSDGSQIMATLLGGSDHHFYVAEDGHVLELISSNPDVYIKTDRYVEDETEVLNNRRLNVTSRRKIGSQATAPLPSNGSPKIPVVLVNFTDSVFNIGESDEEVNHYFDLYCNGTLDGKYYSGHGSYGSIRDYFVSQSDSLFTPEFVVIGPVNLDHPESYYGSNSGSSKDTGYNQFCTDAIIKATEAFEGDWSIFDNRKKGQVDLIFFIFAGCGENYGAPSTTIWPKEKTNTQTYNGIKFATSACCCANRPLWDSSNKNIVSTKPAGIGVMCHELSHALGLPDFYHTQYKAFGMDLWSLMDYGCYASNGYMPSSYTAYERDFMGWRSMETLTEEGAYVLQPIDAGGKGYKIVNDENPNEYYVLENRGKVGWDRGMFGPATPGLQVTHIDFVQSRWNSNTVNTTIDHQLCTIIAANNLYKGTYNDNFTTEEILETWRGNLYPFAYTDKQGLTQYNDSLTAYSVPAATVYTESGFMNKDIRHITRLDNGDVSFYFGKQYPDKVVALPSSGDVDELFYDLSGRRVSSKRPSLPGVYVTRKGRKIVVH